MIIWFDRDANGRLPGSGRLLQLTSIGHAAVGVALYREELRAIARERVVGAVPYKGSKATAFWFVMSAPSWWLVGHLVGAAEEAGDENALRVASRVALAIASVGVMCTPVSGFWGLLLISLRGRRQARRVCS